MSERRARYRFRRKPVARPRPTLEIRTPQARIESYLKEALALPLALRRRYAELLVRRSVEWFMGGVFNAHIAEFDLFESAGRFPNLENTEMRLFREDAKDRRIGIRFRWERATLL